MKLFFYSLQWSYVYEKLQINTSQLPYEARISQNRYFCAFHYLYHPFEKVTIVGVSVTQLLLTLHERYLKSVLFSAWHTGITISSWPRNDESLIDWMNTLFVFRRLFSKTQFFARNPSQGYICGLDNHRNIFQSLRSLEWGLEHFSKSIIFVGIKTMSADNAENSTILENLRKSLKEQVCSES